jgi:hypothetical protein
MSNEILLQAGARMDFDSRRVGARHEPTGEPFPDNVFHRPCFEHLFLIANRFIANKYSRIRVDSDAPTDEYSEEAVVAMEGQEN